MEYVLTDLKQPPRLDLFGPAPSLEEYDLYWMCYANSLLSRDVRKQLKAAGWLLSRHTRTNEEVWAYDKVDWAKTKH